MKKLNEEFILKMKQQKSLDHVKKNISENAIKATNQNLQFHLSANVSLKITKTCLFQLRKMTSNTQITVTFKNNFKMIIFMSFQLNDIETK